MHILFYTMNWYPFQGSIQPIYGAVLKHLKEKGYEITILTSIPYFLNGREDRWSSYRGKFFVTEYWEGIKVIRIFVLSPRLLRRFTKGIRVFNFISFIINSLIRALFVSKPDIIMTVSHPPLFIGINSWIISRLKKCKYIYCLEDIYPDILCDLKIIRKRMVFNILKKLELFTYKTAAKICVLSSAMAQNLMDKNVPSEKIRLIPHFADTDLISPLPRNNNFSKQTGLDGKFVVLLPGSISYRYGIDIIFESAMILRDNEEIVFLFIDRGELREQLKQKATSEKLKNIQFLPFQPSEMFPYVLASSDVCLVSLDKNFASYSVPSKLYNIMASARAVLAIAEKDSEVARIVIAANCGIVVPPNDPQILAQKIHKLTSDKQGRNKMGQKGYNFVWKNYDKNIICRKYDELICETVTVSGDKLK